MGSVLMVICDKCGKNDVKPGERTYPEGWGLVKTQVSEVPQPPAPPAKPEGEESREGEESDEAKPAPAPLPPVLRGDIARELCPACMAEVRVASGIVTASLLAKGV